MRMSFADGQSNRGAGHRGALCLLLLLAALCMWQLGFATDKSGGGDVLPGVQMSPNVQISPDEAGVARWRQYCDELAVAAKQVQVAVYSTHSSESYTAYSGESKVYGSRGGVYRASEVLCDTLAAEGVGAVVDQTIHDWPDWNKSYANSCVTAENLLTDYPNLRLLVDMHRDAGVSRKNSVAVVNGQSAAKIMLVCGSDKRYEHPNWRRNEALMEQIAAKCDELFPGLLRRVSVQTGRYNQHLSNRAILVEMGTTENTIEEVEYSARLLAEVLAQVLSGE